MSDRNIIDLLYLAKQNKVDLFLNEGQLQVKLPKDKGFDKSILEQLKANKEALTAFLAKNERGSLTNNKITKADKDKFERLPLSFNQERLWFVDQLEGSISYHLPSIITLKGRLDIRALEYALKSVVERHEVLRTVILSEDGAGYQEIIQADNWRLNVIDEGEYTADEKGLENLIEKLINIPFNLTKDYMLRADLVCVSKEEYRLVVTMHHIASDGWSASILVHELIELYDSYIQQRSPKLKDLEIQYSDYAVWQRNYLTEEILDKKLDYWKNQLDGLEQLQFPTDYPRPAVWVPTGAIKSFSFEKDLSQQLQSLSQKQGCSLFMTLMAAFNVLLYRYSGQEDICIGTSLAGRQHKETEDLIGFFINIVALRSSVKGGASFLDLLQAAKQTTLEAFENQEVSFGKVVEAVVKDRDQSRNALCQVMLVLQNTPDVPELRLGQLSLSLSGYEKTSAQYDIIVRLTESPSGITGTIQYSTALYLEETMDRLIENFKVLLTSIVNNPQSSMDALPLLSEAERKKLLEDFNNNAASYPKNKTIIDLFKEQVAARPEACAVVFEEKKVSYKELDERSNQLAHYLQRQGIKKETLVPICIERGEEMVVGILGILKAGGAYVPIDPDYPVDRIKYMLDDASAELVLCSKAVRSKLAESMSDNIIELDTNWPLIASMPVDDSNARIAANNLCYIIYTSGSTGRPKGVMVEHQGVVNLALSQAEALRLKPGMKTLQFASLGFDASCYEIFNTLLSGGTLVLCNKEDLTSSERIGDLISRHEVEVAVLPPSYQNIIVDSLGTLKTIVSAGEPLNEAVGRRIQDQGVRLINAYGPTENTVCVSLTNEPIQKNHVVIGKPIANVKVYITDKAGGLSPLGSTGEICVAGPQVTRGYLNRSDLTAEKFISNSFNNLADSTLYKTGDLARWLPDGNIEYQGRLDEQVKIRGYRIELGEIESVLLQSGYIQQAVVVAQEEKENHKQLVAYVIPNDEFDKEAIVGFLQTKLPEYMVPSLWIPVQEFPLTPSGKIDKKALAALQQNGSDTNEDAGARNELEQKLIEVWQELLEVDQMGIYDNFFELGGDSILTIQVVSRIRKFGYHLEVADIFNHQTIASLSSFIAAQSGKAMSGEQGILTGNAGLLPIQEWYFEKIPASVSHYNQSVLLSINKSVTQAQLKDAVDQLLTRHDALRFRYYQNKGQWQQEYTAQGHHATLVIETLSFASTDSLSNLITDCADKYQRSLDIIDGQLVKFVWIQTPQAEVSNRLFIAIHHLVIDGVSWRILLEELENLLISAQNDEKIDLGSKTSSYRQWYEALKKYGQTPALHSQIAYWATAVTNYSPLRIDKEYSGIVKAREVDALAIRLNKQQTKNLLQEVPRVYHTEINDILLCALVKTICDWNETNSMVVGMEGHGREHVAEEIDLTRTVGWFTTLYPLYLNTSGTVGLGDLIKTVKEQLRQLPEKGLGYGVLRYINKDDLLQGDAWDVQFNYLGQLDSIVKDSQILAVGKESTGTGKSEEQGVSEKLSVNSFIREGELVVTFSYSTLHFHGETIEKISQSFVSNLALLIDHCLEQGKSGAVFTPSDYGLGSAVSYEELDAFLEEDESDNIMSF
jgi:amino acid adenylation domain-containing protein/non-ribosomal peptide synthase protein (TIGR01720 family)